MTAAHGQADPAPGLILASGSERRAKILSGLRVPFRVVVPSVREARGPLDPRGTALGNARRKAAWCVRRHPRHPVIAADTVIEFEGRCVGKPASRGEAVELLGMFSGREHRVLTAVALRRPGTPVEVHLAVSTVRFKPLDERTIRRYLSRVNPLDKAGAYDIDQCGSLIIESFSGSRTNIMGLPRETIQPWLRTCHLLPTSRR